MADDSSMDEFSFDFELDASDLSKLDKFIKDTEQGRANPVVPPPKAVQTTLDGRIAQPVASTSKPKSSIQKVSSSSSTTLPFGHSIPKTKMWDHTAWAKSGWKKPKGKGKEKERDPEDDWDDAEAAEFEEFPAPFVPTGPPTPMKIQPDLLEAKHWLYPLNHPKRDYQFNIIKHCLFENTIVALPTGLGKTFVAGVVMLNYYRWFPEGKIVFCCPTKPLVAQQIEACHKTCGIPGNDAAELTGGVKKADRVGYWHDKRVFYLTPQTFQSDLASSIVDPKDVVLIVFDEAHKATGDSSYSQVMRFMMAKNPHFRVLALTATPASRPDDVQRIVDSLHISHIEIRSETSIDTRQYVHDKNIQQHIISMDEDYSRAKKAILDVMEPHYQHLKQRGKGLPPPEKLTPYFCQMKRSELMSEKWTFGPLSVLGDLARGFGYLMEGSAGHCLFHMTRLQKSIEEDPKKNSSRKKMCSDPKFKAILAQLKTLEGKDHPKLDMLKTIMMQHFGARMEDSEEDKAEAQETRAMVFVNFRHCVDEIVRSLNENQPLIRAHRFIGQAAGQDGVKGMSQKEQGQVIQRFKNGEFNVLVATNVGEEGLDIGEVDLIVCYDAQKTPIRMLQRAGRAGRKRSGDVHVLLADGREELNLDKAKDAYKAIQKAISSGRNLELYGDVERLLPAHIKPECIEKVMEIQEYVRSDSRKRTASTQGGEAARAGTKRKRNTDIGRNIPAGASTGFKPVLELLDKGSKKKRKVLPNKNLDSAGEDDEDDMDIESGVIAALMPRSVSDTALQDKKKKTTRKGLRKTASSKPAPKAKGKRKKKDASPSPCPSKLSDRDVDDSDDLEIENGLIDTSRPREMSRSSSPEEPLAKVTAMKRDQETMDITDTSEPGDLPLESDSPQHQPSSPHEQRKADMGWLVDDDDDPDLEIMNSSPVLEFKRPLPPVPKASASKRSPKRLAGFAVDLTLPSSSPGRSDQAHVDAFRAPASPAAVDLDDDSYMPEPSFAIGHQRRRKPRVVESSSPTREDALPRRLERKKARPVSPFPPEQVLTKSRPRSKHKLPRKDNPAFDCEAIHSGDEASEGGSDSADDVEDESDRQFAGNFDPTQASAGYNQALAYRQGLMTQAPGTGPAFGNGPIRKGKFGVGSSSDMSSKRRPGVSSSPAPDSEPDEYQFGSFIARDDVEIEYDDD